MPRITGTGTFTNSDNAITAITGLSQTMIGVVEAGSWLKIDEETLHYNIALDASGDTSLTLQEDYQGVTGSKTFQIFTDFIDGEIPRLTSGMTGSFFIMNDIYKIFIDRIAAAGAPLLNTQVITFPYIGEPVSEDEFGYFKSSAPIEIDKLRLRTDKPSPDNTVTIDYSIESVYQNLDLTLANPNTSSESAELTSVVSAGEVVRLKWKNITLPAGNTYFVDMIYHTTSILKTRYDYNATVYGQLEVDQIIWNNFKFPVKSKVFAVTIEYLNYLGEGGDQTFELLLDGASLGTPVTFTVTEGSTTFYVALAQTDYETTETCSIKVNSLGTIPPQHVVFRLHSYEIE